ncbi:MAG: peptidylprolyl isomerase [Gammaproteobacteria bacterium]|nr:peptidylprolyl isomerase [Gammaproteobacteria bacterium]
MPDSRPANSRVQLLLREPVFHFFLMALLIFAVYGLSHRNQENMIEIDQRDIDARIFMQEMANGEALNDEQKEFITARYVEEQLLVREALAMGLDNDLRIHDLLAQKMLHVLSGEVIQPTDNEMQNYYTANIERYQIPAIRDVIELVFDTQDQLSQQILTLLQAGAETEQLMQLSPGSSEPLPGINRLDVTNIFSGEFANEVFASEVGKWVGPFVSNRGQHWLQTTNISPKRTPGLDEVRDQVRLDWIQAEEDVLLQLEINRLFDKYTVIITQNDSNEH